MLHNDNDKVFICDYIDIIRAKYASVNQGLDSYLDVIQSLAQRMEDVIVERKQNLIDEGYIKCPLCGSMSKPDIELGFKYFNCCGFIK